MSATTNRWKLGLFVVLGTAALVTGLALFGMSRLQRDTHPVWAFFDEEVTGLEPGSAVRFRGVLIGTVGDVAPAQDGRHIEVRMEWFDDKLQGLGLSGDKLDRGELPADMRGQIVTYALTHTAFVMVGFFADGAEGRQQLPFPVPAAWLPTVRGTYSSLEAGLRTVPEVLTSVRSLLDDLRQDLQALQLPTLKEDVRQLVAKLSQKLDSVQLQPLLDEGRAAVHDLGQLARAMQDPDSDLHRLLQSLRELAAQADAALQQAALPATAEALRAASGRVGTAADEFAGLGRDARAELQRLRASLAALDRLVLLLERDPAVLLHGRPATASPLKKD